MQDTDQAFYRLVESLSVGKISNTSTLLISTVGILVNRVQNNVTEKNNELESKLTQGRPTTSVRACATPRPSIAKSHILQNFEKCIRK